MKTRSWAFQCLDQDDGADFDEDLLNLTSGVWPGGGFPSLGDKSQRKSKSREQEGPKTADTVPPEIPQDLVHIIELAALSVVQRATDRDDARLLAEVHHLAWVGYDSEPGTPPEAFNTKEKFIAQIRRKPYAAWHWANVACKRFNVRLET